MSGVNRCTFIGNLGADAELRYTTNGGGVANFRLAVNESWKDANGEKQERTEWVSCVLFGKRAEAIAKYLLKGKQLYVEGRLQTRSWEDKEGNKRYTTEVVCNDVQFLGSKQDSTRPQHRETHVPRKPELPPQSEFGDDDIPFLINAIEYVDPCMDVVPCPTKRARLK